MTSLPLLVNYFVFVIDSNSDWLMFENYYLFVIIDYYCYFVVLVWAAFVLDLFALMKLQVVVHDFLGLVVVKLVVVDYLFGMVLGLKYSEEKYKEKHDSIGFYSMWIC